MTIRRLQAKQWKTVLSQKASTEGVVVLKGLDVEAKQEGAEGDRVLRFTISSDRVDRDNDTLAMDGWELDNFQKTGPVLWAHDGRKPAIATAIHTWIEDGVLRSTAKFLPADLADHEHVKFADMIYKMYLGGYMRSLSVGFKPLRYAHNEERGGFYPIDYTRQELLEYSAVPVPSNVDALYEARSAGIDLGPMKMWAESVMDQDSSSGVWIPREQAAELRKALDTSTSVQVPAELTVDATPADIPDQPAGQAQANSGPATPAEPSTELDTDPATEPDTTTEYRAAQDAADEAFASLVDRTIGALLDIAKAVKAGRETPSVFSKALEAWAPEPQEPTPEFVDFDFTIPTKTDNELFDINQLDMNEIGTRIGVMAKDAAAQAVTQLTGRLP